MGIKQIARNIFTFYFFKLIKREDILERLFLCSSWILLQFTFSLYSTILFSGVTIGAGYSLAQLNDALHLTVLEQPKEKTKTYRALLKHLRTLAGAQIRNMAVCTPVWYERSHSYRQSLHRGDYRTAVQQAFWLGMLHIPVLQTLLRV